MSIYKRADSCKTGGFYKSPLSGVAVNALEPLSVAWDITCINSTTLDLYLFAPGQSSALLWTYKDLPNSDGSYNATIMPRWWNSTSTEQLQITLIASGSDLWESELPAGPVFDATYTAPSDGSVPAIANTSIADSANHETIYGATVSGAISHKTSKGAIAAAVLLPLIVIALGVLAWLKISRRRGQVKRQEWNEKVDKRMSTISQDWKPMSAAAANASIRNSIYSTAGGRASFMFGAGATSPASMEAGHGHSAEMSDNDRPLPAHIRPNYRAVIQTALDNRVSRVSFAADTRPSGESRRSRRLVSTYSTSAQESFEVPPLPNPLPRKDSISSEASDGAMSPRQRAGALTLSNEEIKRRISQRQSRASVRSGKSSFDEVLPALTLMRSMSIENDPTYQISYPSVPMPTLQQTSNIPPKLNLQDPSLASYNTAYAFASPVPPTPGAFATAPTLFDAGEDIGSPTPTSEVFNVGFTSSSFTGMPITDEPGVMSPVSEHPAAPAPAQNNNYGSQFGGMRSMGVPTPTGGSAFMSPDDMLKAYASSRQSTVPSIGSSGSSYTTVGTTGFLPMPPPAANAPSFKSTVLGKGVGISGSVRRSLVPSAPGSFSAARGAYGVAE